MKIRPLFAWYNLWIGAYWDRTKRRLYVLPLPTLGFYVEFTHSPASVPDDARFSVDLELKETNALHIRETFAQITGPGYQFEVSKDITAPVFFFLDPERGRRWELDLTDLFSETALRLLRLRKR